MPQQNDPQGLETTHLRKIFDFSGASVLEIGCGDGRLTNAYCDLPSQITGIDLQREQLTSARQNHPQMRFAEASALKLPFRDQAFDVVLFAWSY